MFCENASNHLYSPHNSPDWNQVDYAVHDYEGLQQIMYRTPISSLDDLESSSPQWPAGRISTKGEDKGAGGAEAPKY